MKMIHKVAAVAGVAGTVFFLSPASAQAFCGSLCSPEAAALAAELGGTAATVPGLTASTVAVTQVGTAATASGQILGIAVTGGLASVAAGLTIFGSGLPDWIWSPSTTALPPDPSIPYAAGDTVLPEGVGWQGTFATTRPYSTTIVGAPSYGQTTIWNYSMLFSMPAKVAGSTGNVGWETQVSCVNSPTTWTTANSGAVGAIPSTVTSAAYATSVPASKCGSLGGIAQLRSHTATAWTSNLVVSTYSPWTYFYPSGSPDAPKPTEIVPGRTIEQTISCRRPDGSTYSRTSSTVADTLHPDTRLAVAGLMCDKGDAVSTASAAVKTPHAADVAITSGPSFLPGWAAAGPSGQAAMLNTPGTFTATITPTGATVSQTAAPVDPSTSGCGFAFGDVLNGTIMFKAVGCALSWAFVPDPAVVQTAVQTSTDAWSGSSVGTFTSAAAAIPLGVAQLGSVQGSCEGPTFHVPLGQITQDVQPLNACSDPMRTVATWVKVVSTVLIVIFGVLFISYPILRALGLPQLRRGSGDSDGD